MPEERVCDYTGEPIEPGTGIMYVQSDGTILHFVDSKAEKNYLLGRESRDLPWTAAGRAARDAQRATRDATATEQPAGGDPESGEEVADADETDETGVAEPTETDGDSADPDEVIEDEDPLSEAEVSDEAESPTETEADDEGSLEHDEDDATENESEADDEVRA